MNLRTPHGRPTELDQLKGDPVKRRRRLPKVNSVPRLARRRFFVPLLALAALAGVAPAAQADAGPTGKIVFTSGRTGFDIYTMNADGSAQTRVTAHSAIDQFPVWSPDGEQIAFTSDRDGNYEVYTMNADGTAVVRLTNSPGNDVPSSWSSDGSKIAFSSQRSGSVDVFVMNADGSGQTQVTDGPGTDTSGDFSPDGTRLVFGAERPGSAHADIYVIDVDGTDETRLTTNPTLDQAPAWAPDGSKIVFESVRDGVLGLFMMNPDGSEQARFTTGSDQGVSWSPDSNYLAFSRSVAGNIDVYRIGRDGTGLTRLTTSYAYDGQTGWGLTSDSTPPVLTLPSSITREATSPAGAPVTYAASALDDTDGVLAPACTPVSGSTFAIGSTTVSCSATDQAGNSSTGSFAVVVEDTTAPVLSVPGTITVDATSPAGVLVNYAASATDAVGATVACSPASGGEFAIGTTVVTCTATDGAGNRSTAIFSVIVKGAAAQITDLAADISALNLKGGISNSLDAKLQNLVAALEDVRGGATASACSKLNSVVNEVNAQAGKEITQADAVALLAELARISAVLAC